MAHTQTFTKEDFQKFEEEAKKYFNSNGGLTLEKHLQFLVDKKIIVLYPEGGYGLFEDKIAEYKHYQNLISQWEHYRGKKAYAKKKELIELQKMAETMEDTMHI